MPSIPAIERWRTSSACSFLLVGLALIDSPVARAQVLHEFNAGREFTGPVQRATFSRDGVAWIATPRELYKVIENSPRQVETTGSKDRRIAMAPGGGRYAWLESGTAPYGRYAAEIFDLNRPSHSIATLRPLTGSIGFSTIQFGSEGGLLLTVTPLQNVEGLRGEFQYHFWSRGGQPLGTMKLQGPRIEIMDEQNAAALLLGESDAVAYGRDGIRLWQVDGRFRKGALAASGKIGLLNPAREINEVRVVRGGIVTAVKMSGPVYEMALTPDAAFAAVATSGGRLTILDLNTCDAQACRSRRVALPVTGNYNISAVRFIDRSTVVVGTIRSIGNPPNAKYESGALSVVTTDGVVKFHKNDLTLPQPPTKSPLLDVNFGQPEFAAYTRDSVFFVRVAH